MKETILLLEETHSVVGCNWTHEVATILLELVGNPRLSEDDRHHRID